MWWAYTRGGLYSGGAYIRGGAYSRRFTVLTFILYFIFCCVSKFTSILSWFFIRLFHMFVGW